MNIELFTKTKEGLLDCLINNTAVLKPYVKHINRKFPLDDKDRSLASGLYLIEKLNHIINQSDIEVNCKSEISAYINVLFGMVTRYIENMNAAKGIMRDELDKLSVVNADMKDNIKEIARLNSQLGYLNTDIEFK